MDISSRKAGKIWSNVFSVVGAAGCSVVSLWTFGLIGYYTANRPRQPIPERGWTEQLRWSYGCYGAHEENEQLLQLHYWFFPFIVMGGAGVWIKSLQEKNEPWRVENQRW
jgi:hypothetical protein